MISTQPILHVSALLIRTLVFVGVMLYAAVSHAQITLDGSLGPKGPLTGPNYAIGHELGQIRGRNLFHSFALFNVLKGESATFTGPNTGPNSILNIISRVTGRERSFIDGLLKSEIQGANLFLLNPAGVLFGANARLDVKGSFHVSTANYLRFENGAKFFANLSQESVLTAAPPSAFGFLGPTAERISVEKSFLRVPDGRTLSIIAGDVEITGPAQLRAPHGRVNIASGASAGEVTNIFSASPSTLNVSTFSRLGHVRIADGANVNVNSATGAGTVVIRSGRLVVTNEAQISANTLGDADGASIGIDIKTGSLELPNGASITSITRGKGRGGDILIATDDILIAGQRSGKRTQITAKTEAHNGGDGGSVRITTQRLEMKDGALIDVSTDGSGHGGAVDITAQNVSLTGVIDRRRTNINAETTALHGGDAGNVVIRTGTLQVRDGAHIGTATRGSGHGGNIDISADSVLVAGSLGGRDTKITAESRRPNSSDGGKVRITARSLEVRDLASINVNTVGSGAAGNLDITSGRVLIANGGSLVALTSGSGKGGDITIHADQVSLDNNGLISTSSTGTGTSGNISITARDKFVSRNSTVTTGALQADGGNIDLRAGSIVYLNRSKVTTSVGTGQGHGGNITIDPQFVVLDHSQIRADAFGGPGGNVNITAKVYLTQDSVVGASSALGVPGTINIQASITDVSGSLARLPEAVLHGGELLRASCAARLAGTKASSLVLAGRDGLPLEPGGLLPSPLYLEGQANAPSAGPSVTWQKLPTSRFTLLGSNKESLRRVQIWSQHRLSQAAFNLGCSG